MGTMYYGDSSIPIRLDDLTLAHLKVVIATKLRRRESFTLSWVHVEGESGGRSTVWLHPAIPLRFDFDEPEQPRLDRALIEHLAAQAGASGGIVLPAAHGA